MHLITDSLPKILRIAWVVVFGIGTVNEDAKERMGQPRYQMF